MPKYDVRFTVTKSQVIEADNLEEASRVVRAGLTQFTEATLLSVIQQGVKVSYSLHGPDDKGPGPFSRPPGGTPGSPPAQHIPPPVDQIAEAA